jgi:tetratricopeptide (TPR) repeat protein
MNLYVIIAASSVILAVILLIVKTNFASKKRIRYKDRATLNQILEEEEYSEIKTESHYELATANRAGYQQGSQGAANNQQKINFSDKKPLEKIVNDITNFENNGPEELFPYLTDIDAYYENKPDAVDYAQNPSGKSSKNYELGLLLLKGKKFKESIEYFDKAIEINPADGIPFYYRGLAKSYINLTDEAIEDYTDAMLRKLNIIDVFYQRGISKYKVGDKTGALNDLTRYVSVEKSNAEAFYYKGLIDFEMEEYSTAIEEFNRTIILNPNHASAYFKRGMAKHHTGNTQSSCRDLKTAYEKGNLEAFHYMKQFCKE